MSFSLLYIDPGTGSMLFSVFIGIAAAASFGLRALFLKCKFLFTGGKAKTDEKRLPFVIFSDHKRYWNVFKPIADEAEKRGLKTVYFTASPDDPVLTADYKNVTAEYLGEKNKPYARLNLLSADILLSTTPGLDVLQWKRSKGVKWYVHVPHTVDDLSGYRMFGLDYYDAVLTSGKNQVDLIRTIESLRPSIAKKELFTVGSPQLDTMIAKRKTLAKNTPRENEKKIVLVAPSWGKSGILSRYGEKLLCALEKTPYKIIVRPHPQTIVSEQDILKPLTQKFTSIEWNYDNDNFDVLSRSDILITDFSGIIFDYSLVFDKPLIYADTSFDTLPYDADWLSEPMWSLRVLPKLGVELKESDFENISSVIYRAMASTDLKAGRDEVRAECWEHQGEAAARIVDYIENKLEELECKH